MYGVSTETQMMWDRFGDPDLMRMVIFGEAEGEGVLGQLAVASVVRNRVNDPDMRFGKSWRQVILRPLQFSCFNQDSVRIPKMIKFVDHCSPIDLWNQINWVTAAVMYNHVRDDITDGSLFYMTKDKFSTDRPKWAANAYDLIEFGNQIFFKIKEGL